MKLKHRKAEYYNFTVPGRITEGSQLLTAIADAGVDFLTCQAVPIDPDHTRFTLFPANGAQLTAAAMKAGLK